MVSSRRFAAVDLLKSGGEQTSMATSTLYLQYKQSPSPSSTMARRPRQSAAASASAGPSGSAQAAGQPAVTPPAAAAAAAAAPAPAPRRRGVVGPTSALTSFLAVSIIFMKSSYLDLLSSLPHHTGSRSASSTDQLRRHRHPCRHSSRSSQQYEST